MNEEVSQSMEEFLLGFDLVLGVHSTLQIKSYLLGIPTLFYEKDMDQLEKALNKENFQQNYRYDNFKTCCNRAYFESQTNRLVEKIKVLIKEKL